MAKIDEYASNGCLHAGFLKQHKETYFLMNNEGVFEGKHNARGFDKLKQHGLAPLLTHCWVQGSFGIFTIASMMMQL